MQREPELAIRSAVALAVGFPLAITAVYVAVQLFRATGLFTDTFSQENHGLANLIANPDFFTFFVAACAGAAGMLSLSTAKSGALIGVLISVTTIPAAANVGLSAAYQDWPSWRGSMAQLAINLGAIMLAGTAVLAVQRLLYRRRRRRHRHEERHAARPGRTAAQTDEPSVDQISIFVLTFSTTAPANSDVVAWPPRSIVLTPPAVVSSTLS